MSMPLADARPPPMTIFAATTLATVFAASSVPTPLYRVYQLLWHLTPLTLTTIFAVYALSLIASLLVVGSLSDHVGRRPVILVSVSLSAAAMLLFACAASAGVLVAARVLQGGATGAAVGALGAAILDTNPRRGALINSVTPFVGLSAGAVGSAALATYAPAPTRLVYVVVGALLLSQALLVLRLRETAVLRPGAWASLRPRLAVPPQARRTLLRVMPANIALWSLSGFYLSLMPSLVRQATGMTSMLIGAAVVCALTLSAAAVVLGLRGWPAHRLLTTGSAALALGVAVTLCGIHLRAMQLLLPGTMIVGFGVGSGFSGAARSLLPLAEPDQRAGLLSAFYALSYLAFSLPTIAIGLVARRIGLVDASYLYGAVMIVLAVTSLTASLAPGWRGSVVRQGDGGGVGGLPRQAPPCPAELREP